jgi:CBS domain-containing protein
MNVKAILAAKKRNLGGDIVSIEPTANLAAAAKSLSAHRIGAVLIRGAAGRLAGILSERLGLSRLATWSSNASRRSRASPRR